MGKYYSEHELLNNMYDIVDENGCILTVLDKDTLKTLPPLMPVRQPVHAHWIHEFIDADWNCGVEIHCGWVCSNCDWYAEMESRTKYCPNCGAKMDVEAKS